MKLKQIIFTLTTSMAMVAYANPYIPCEEECGDVMETESILVEGSTFHDLEAIVGNSTLLKTHIATDSEFGSVYNLDGIVLSCVDEIGYIIYIKKNEAEVIAIRSDMCN